MLLILDVWAKFVLANTIPSSWKEIQIILMLLILDVWAKFVLANTI